MSAAPSSVELGAVKVAECRAKIDAMFKGTHDKFGHAWNVEMGEAERVFWLRAAGLSAFIWSYSKRMWADIADENRVAIKNAVRRVASRAAQLVEPSQMVM